MLVGYFSSKTDQSTTNNPHGNIYASSETAWQFIKQREIKVGIYYEWDIRGMGITCGQSWKVARSVMFMCLYSQLGTPHTRVYVHAEAQYTYLQVLSKTIYATDANRTYNNYAIIYNDQNQSLKTEIIPIIFMK